MDQYGVNKETINKDQRSDYGSIFVGYVRD